ncbi:MAG: fumarate hydratase [Candidatus Marinimicrobia bacterium]|nr:fumarate hydratase [Candidatus Neomarinimicrobiota bacterium]
MRTDFNEKAFTERTVVLIRKSSCELPDDIRDALQKAKNAEAGQSTARYILDTILENVQAAKSTAVPGLSGYGAAGVPRGSSRGYSHPKP